jgi:hypothetical protein
MELLKLFVVIPLGVARLLLFCSHDNPLPVRS